MSESSVFPDNRFVALDQFLNLLGFRRFEWQSLFKVFSRANCGFIEFKIGDVDIEVNIGSGESIAQDEKNLLRIIFRRIKDNVEKTATYAYELTELKALGKEKKMNIQSLKR